MITGNEPVMPLISTKASFANHHEERVYGDVRSIGGLTIRQYFAVMAMQGILSNPEFLANHKDIDIHSLSVRNADHLIAELNKDQ